MEKLKPPQQKVKNGYPYKAILRYIQKLTENMKFHNMKSKFEKKGIGKNLTAHGFREYF